MPRRGDNIHKRKDGRWEGRYKNGFKPDGSVKYTSVYDKTFLGCKKKLEIAIQKTDKHLHSKDFNLSDLLYKWLNMRRIKIKGATELKYRNIIDTHIIPEIGRMKASEIDTSKINAFLENKIKNGRKKGSGPLSPSYIKTMAIILNAVIEFAAAEGLCKPLNSPIFMPIVQKKDISILKESEEARFLKALSAANCPASIGIVLALQAGLRIGEVCALRWKDVVFEQSFLRVRYTVSRVVSDLSDKKSVMQLESPKTPSSRRDIPMTDFLKSVLLKAYIERTSEFVVSKTSSFVNTRTFDYQYKKFLKENDLPIINFHRFRHVFATKCAQSGMDAKTLSIILGHSNASVTLNVYVHPAMSIIHQQINDIFAFENGQYCGQKNVKTQHL